MWTMVIAEGRSIFVTRDDMARMAYDTRHDGHDVRRVKERFTAKFSGIEALFIAPLGTTREDLAELGIG